MYDFESTMFKIHGEGWNYESLGNKEKENYEEAIQLFQKASDIYRKNKDDRSYFCLRKIMFIYMDKGEYEKAAKLAEKMAYLKIYEDNDLNDIIHLYDAVLFSMAYKGAGAREELEKYYKICPRFYENRDFLEPYIVGLETLNSDKFDIKLHRFYREPDKYDYDYVMLDIIKKKYLHIYKFDKMPWRNNRDGIRHFDYSCRSAYINTFKNISISGHERKEIREEETLLLNHHYFNGHILPQCFKKILYHILKILELTEIEIEKTFKILNDGIDAKVRVQKYIILVSLDPILFLDDSIEKYYQIPDSRKIRYRSICILSNSFTKDINAEKKILKIKNFVDPFKNLTEIYINSLISFDGERLMKQEYYDYLDKINKIES